MSFVRACFAIVVAGAACAVVACPAASPSARAPGPLGSGATSASSTGDAPIATASGEPETSASDASTPQLGTAVKTPVFSTDSCDKDGDCGAVATCHSSKCVAIAHVGSMPSGMMCTMDCRGGTIDCAYNHCGCAPSPSGKKLCALLAGPAKKP